jgi:ElaB/YqjD/DUF883 family membrane-anchored ribosome-binding protein
MSKTIGFITLWKLSDMDIRYTDAQDLADKAGLNPAYTPKQPNKRNAWEKATNLGAKGLKVDPPQMKRDEVQRIYGVEPKVRLYTEVISASAPLLIRHIVRTVTIPHDDPYLAKEQLAERQLDSQTVCIMEYDCDTGTMKSTGYTELNDKTGWVNGNLQQIVRDLMDDVVRKVNYADGNEVAIGIRNCLLDMGATLMSAGGAYFVPYSAFNYDQLQGLKRYVESLSGHLVNQTKRIQFSVFPLTDEGDLFNTRADVAANAIESFKSDLQKLADELQPVLKSERTRQVSDNIRSRVTIEFMAVKSKISQYREILEDNLDALDFYVKSVANSVVEAQLVDTYKPTKNEREAQEVSVE